MQHANNWHVYQVSPLGEKKAALTSVSSSMCSLPCCQRGRSTSLSCAYRVTANRRYPRSHEETPFPASRSTYKSDLFALGLPSRELICVSSVWTGTGRFESRGSNYLRHRLLTAVGRYLGPMGALTLASNPKLLARPVSIAATAPVQLAVEHSLPS